MVFLTYMICMQSLITMETWMVDIIQVINAMSYNKIFYSSPKPKAQVMY